MTPCLQVISRFRKKKISWVFPWLSGVRARARDAHLLLREGGEDGDVLRRAALRKGCDDEQGALRFACEELVGHLRPTATPKQTKV